MDTSEDRLSLPTSPLYALESRCLQMSFGNENLELKYNMPNTSGEEEPQQVKKGVRLLHDWVVTLRETTLVWVELSLIVFV